MKRRTTSSRLAARSSIRPEQRSTSSAASLTFDGHAFQNGFRYPLGSRDEPNAGDEILFACGGNMISRRETLMELGGFDDDYFAYLEDVDFGWRTWIAGGRVLFEPRATVRHASSTTSNRLGDFERGVLFERNALQTAIKNYENIAEAGGGRVLHVSPSSAPLRHDAQRRSPRIETTVRNAFASDLAAFEDPAQDYAPALPRRDR